MTSQDPVASSAVRIEAAKGRPMLTWVGKRPLRRLPVFPAQLVEIYGQPQASSPAQQRHPPNALYHGDNKEVLAHLLAHGFRGRVTLVYIDPPFDSGADYVRSVRLRGVRETASMAASNLSLGEQIQYTDIWHNDNYLQFMYERLLLLRELLSEDGTLWLHCDHRRDAHLRLLLEEVFGPDNYLNTISWRSQVARGAKVNAFYFPHSCQYIHIFARNRSTPPIWNPPRQEILLTARQAARRYMQDHKGFFRTSDPGSYSFERLLELHAQARLYAPHGGDVVVDQERRRIYGSQGGSIGIKYYLERRGDRYVVSRAVDNLWDDIPGLGTTPGESVNYPTQKTEALLRRIVQTATNPGDLVLDCFAGSGTTLAAAQKLGRPWIGCDINLGSIQTASQRLYAAMAGTAEHGGEEEAGSASEPAELPQAPGNHRPSFAVYRVNHYDLSLPRAEAADLACEHLGVRRTRNDEYFDGLMGNRLAKVVPLQRPLTTADLDDLDRVLRTRSEEGRNVVLVCLGKTLAVDPWVEQWNRQRAANHLEVIELRNDERYGRFIVHRPASARVAFRRQNGRIQVEIEDFISPTIVERLQIHAASLRIHLDDWRAMVASVAIDTAYDGEVFRVVHADIPPGKDDRVAGSYELPLPATSGTPVAVKILDMLGEEILILEGSD